MTLKKSYSRFLTIDNAFDSMFLSKIGPCSVSGSALGYYHIRRGILRLKAPLRCLERSVYDVSNGEQHKELTGELVIHSRRNRLHLCEGSRRHLALLGCCISCKASSVPEQTESLLILSRTGPLSLLCFAFGVKANLWLTWELRGGTCSVLAGERLLQTWDAIE